MGKTESISKILSTGLIIGCRLHAVTRERIKRFVQAAGAAIRVAP